MIINATRNLTSYTPFLFPVVDEVEKMGIPCFVGCEAHQRELTKWVVNFYVTTRMIFVCKDHMKAVVENKKKEKRLRKESKL